MRTVRTVQTSRTMRRAWVSAVFLQAGGGARAALRSRAGRPQRRMVSPSWWTSPQATGRPVWIALAAALERFGTSEEFLRTNASSSLRRFNQPRGASLQHIVNTASHSAAAMLLFDAPAQNRHSSQCHDRRRLRRQLDPVPHHRDPLPRGQQHPPRHPRQRDPLRPARPGSPPPACRPAASPGTGRRAAQTTASSRGSDRSGAARRSAISRW